MRYSLLGHVGNDMELKLKLVVIRLRELLKNYFSEEMYSTFYRRENTEAKCMRPRSDSKSLVFPLRLTSGQNPPLIRIAMNQQDYSSLNERYGN
jgi:hypothetical protein